MRTPTERAQTIDDYRLCAGKHARNGEILDGVVESVDGVEIAFYACDARDIDAVIKALSGCVGAELAAGTITEVIA